MNGRYAKGSYLTLTFDNIGGRELAQSYRVLEALVAMKLPSPLGEELYCMFLNVRDDVLQLQQAYIEAAPYQICVKCATEVNMRADPPEHVEAEGVVSHIHCPVLKSDDERGYHCGNNIKRR